MLPYKDDYLADIAFPSESFLAKAWAKIAMDEHPFEKFRADRSM